MTPCILCRTDIPDAGRNRYSRCPGCGSYVYLSDSLSSELNREFYDGVFEEVRAYRTDRIKKNLFYFFKSIDKLLRKREYGEFDAKHRTVLDLLKGGGKRILEIGFGTGDNLVSMLEGGADAYGVDISRANVDRFVEKHPEYSGRVECSTRSSRPADIVYTSALFEHLDDPWKFVDDVNATIAEGGFLVVDNIPVVSRETPNVSPEGDISFWNGIHKAVYSMDGLTEFFSRNGYGFHSGGDFDYFIYRVLSSHKRGGYPMIENVRHPFLSGEKLPGILRYAMLCGRALRMHSQANLGFAVFRRSHGPVGRL